MKSFVPEIDIRDPKSLARARTELTRVLEIVEFALSKYSGNSNGKHQEDLAIPAAVETPPATRESDFAVWEVISSLPNKFSTTDVILGFGNEGKDSRSMIKLALKRAVENGALTLTRRGVGRRPSEYAKNASVVS
jgi:hypothetical protein